MDAERITSLARKYAARATEWRRHLHANPELSFQEHETSRYVLRRLQEAGYDPELGVGGVLSVVADLKGGGPGPTVALRADMDALPIEEALDLPFRSKNPGVMHACGHDAHTAILLGAAAALKELEAEVPGQVRFLFQPAEELPPGGGKAMVEAGVLDDVDMVFALHQGTELDSGEVAVGAGPRNAAADTFKIRILGRASHAARPNDGVDTVVIAGQAVVALQQIVSRMTDPLQPVVLTIGTIHGGTKENIVAPEVALTGTVRTQNEAVRETVIQRMEQILDGVTRAYGASYQLDYLKGYPVMVNDERAAEIARKAAERVLGAGKVKPARVGMYGEDFSYMAMKRPGAMITLGAGTPGSPRPRVGAHNERFYLDEGCIETGIAWYLSTVLQALADLRR